MPKTTPPSAAALSGNTILPNGPKQKRLSLQQETAKSTSPTHGSPTRRNTIHIDSRNSPPKVRKKTNKTVNVMQPTIAEDEVVDVIVRSPIRNCEVASFTIEEDKKYSKLSRQNGKVTNVYDDNISNKLSRSSSVNNSIKSSKQGSVQSLEIVREQYCCLQRKTKLERILFVVVFVLSIIVMTLVVVIIVLAKNKGMQNFKDPLN